MATIADLITSEAQRQGVDPGLALEVANAESNLDPNVSDSPAGAVGIFQLEPATAAQLGVNPRDVNQNITGGITYLRMMLAQFGSIPAALAAYNWGPGNLSKAIAKYGAAWSAHLPAETSAYVSRIVGNLSQAQVSVSVTPTSIINGISQLFSPTSSPATPDQTAASADQGGYLILAGIALAAYVIAEVVLE